MRLSPDSEALQGKAVCLTPEAASAPTADGLHRPHRARFPRQEAADELQRIDPARLVWIPRKVPQPTCLRSCREVRRDQPTPAAPLLLSHWARM